MKSKISTNLGIALLLLACSAITAWACTVGPAQQGNCGNPGVDGCYVTACFTPNFTCSGPSSNYYECFNVPDNGASCSFYELTAYIGGAGGGGCEPPLTFLYSYGVPCTGTESTGPGCY
jgi:hypothetical protein